MTAIQAVFIGTVAVVAVCIGVVVAGVVVLAGAGWALVAAGGLYGAGSAAVGALLLRDDEGGGR